MICRNTLLMAMAALCMLSISATRAFSCSDPVEGSGMDRVALIQSAQVIVLAEAEGSGPSGGLQEVTFRTMEILKGKPRRTYRVFTTLPRSSKAASDNDFDRHRAAVFWSSDAGRSESPCCICGPDHQFRIGARYLLFPDKLGARKSAEIILDPADEWLAYVRAKIGASADTAPAPR